MGGGGEEDGSEEDRDAYRRRFLSSKSFPKSFPRSPEVAREVRGDDGTPGADSDSGPSATHLAPRWPSPELAAAYAKRLRALRVEECSRVDMIQMFQASKARLLQQNRDRLTYIPRQLKKNAQQVWSVICQDIREHWMSYTLSLKTARSILLNSTREIETSRD